MKTEFKFRFGQEVKDKVTGFTGIITGLCEYATGCKQCGVSPKVGSDGKLPDWMWIDETRLELTGNFVEITPSEKEPGGPMQNTPPQTN